MRGRGTQRKRVNNTKITKDRHGRAQRDRIFGDVWAIVDSNHGPPPYQSGALTN
jgi:hypothetical protein